MLIKIKKTDKGKNKSYSHYYGNTIIKTFKYINIFIQQECIKLAKIYSYIGTKKPI